MNIKFTICTLTVLGLLSGCASSPGSASDAEVRQIDWNWDLIPPGRGNLYFEVGSDEPFTGQVVERYSSGEVRNAINVVDGVATGTATDWYRSGQKESETEIVDGVAIGSTTEWYESGQMRSERLIVDEKPSQGTEWYETGQMKSLYTQVSSRTWYETGQMKSLNTRIDGEVSSRTWNENGVETTSTDRREIQHALSLSGGARAAVAEYYQDRGEFPTDNDMAGLAPATAISGQNISSIAVENGVIIVSIGNDAADDLNGKTLILTPTGEPGSVSWQCSSPDIDPSELPKDCR